MGIFSKKINYSDRVWINTDFKHADIISAFRTSYEEGIIPLGVYHFNTFGKEIQKHCESQGLKVHKLNSISDLNHATGEGWLKKCDAILFDSDIITKADLGTQRFSNQGGKKQYSLHLLEHHPTPDPDDSILKYLRKRKDILDPVAYVSLTEPWLQDLMGDRVIPLLQKLGLEADECIQHPLLSKSIRSAQEKIKSKMRRDLPYDSVEEWLAGNIQSV